MTNRVKAPLFYMLVEESARELASRVLLSIFAARRGIASVIMPQWMAWKNFELMPPGTVLFKGNNQLQTRHMKSAKAAGHLVTAIEEEIFGVASSTEIERLFADDTPNACDLLLLQGEHARQVVLNKFPDLASKLVVTGNPRLDLLRAPLSRRILSAGSEIQRSYGDYILINTNIASINPRIEDTYAYFEICQHVGVIDQNKPADWNDFKTWCEWEQGNLEFLTRVMGRLLELPDRPRLILRPHPSENSRKWREAYENIDGVSVIPDGDHAPWTAGARLLLHTGCTTGMEAAMLGTPAISLQGGTSKWHDVHISNHVNPTASSVGQTIALIDQLTKDGAKQDITEHHYHSQLERHVLPTPEKLAASNVIDSVLHLAHQQIHQMIDIRKFDSHHTGWLGQREGKIAPEALSPSTISSIAENLSSDLGFDNAPSVIPLAPGAVAITPPNQHFLWMNRL